MTTVFGINFSVRLFSKRTVCNPLLLHTAAPYFIYTVYANQVYSI